MEQVRRKHLIEINYMINVNTKNENGEILSESYYNSLIGSFLNLVKK